MKCNIFRFLIIFIILFSQIEICLSGMDGYWVAKQMDERNRGKDASIEMEMKLIDKKSKERKRELFIFRKDYQGLDKLILKFTYPKDIKGTSFLVWEHKEEDNERFLYLPALRRVRRIASSEKNENFAGTDFSYEDISGRKLNDYTYKLVNDTATCKGYRCYLLESYPKGKNPKYPRIVSWVRKDSFITLKAEYYNRQGMKEKIFEVNKMERIDDIWTMLEMIMENLKLKHRTYIKVNKVSYNQRISDTYFTERELSKSIR